jgi:primary-amine oxidase
MANSLSLGCDCKGSIHYLDAEFPATDGSIRTIKNAICIHEEDEGILFKHTDFRDESTIVTRARKLIIQQIFTAANYEYAVRVSSLLLPPCRLEEYQANFCGSGYST